MGGLLRRPKMSTPPPIEMPKVEEVPEVEDEELEKEEDKKLKDLEKKRKGRRSTILTGTGLNEIDEENIDQKTLLGD